MAFGAHFFPNVYRLVPSTGQAIQIPMDAHAVRDVHVGSGSGVWITTFSFIPYRFVNP